MSTERAQDDVVGWWWSEKAQYCAAHRPSPPDDVQCTPLTASDVTDETCERCGERLLPRTDTERLNWLSRMAMVIADAPKTRWWQSGPLEWGSEADRTLREAIDDAMHGTP